MIYEGIARDRLLAKLSASTSRVRVVTGPVASGKTMLARQYAQLDPQRTLISIYPFQTWDELSEQLAEAFATSGELIIDGVDQAAPAAVANVLSTIETTIPNGRRYLLTARSREALRLQRYLASGSADWWDAGELAFDAEEIADFARAHGVDAQPEDVEQLRHDSDGWPIVVSWVLREAANSSKSIRNAFDAWAERYSHLFLEFVWSAIGTTDAAKRFRAIVASSDRGDARDLLAQFDALGFPIRRTRTHLRPYRVLTTLAAQDVLHSQLPPPSSGIMMLRLLGNFSCSIDGRNVTFLRRRDQNVLTYIALAPKASVTRAELSRVFWSDAPSTVASQGLRTTLSRLRRVISEASGVDAARFLRIGQLISLALDTVTIDARRFAERIELGKSEENAGNLQRAREHFAVAKKLYAGSLYASEALEPPFLEEVRLYSERHAYLLERLSVLETMSRDERRFTLDAPVRAGASPQFA